MKKIREILIEAFIQATEDPEKAMIAIKNLLPPDLRDSELIIDRLRGVYHNPITVVRAKFTDNAQQVLEYIAQNLGAYDKEYLYQSLSRRIDEKGNIFMRFGKQELFQEKMEIKEMKDTVKMKVAFSKKIQIQDVIVILQEMELIKV